MSFLVSLDAAAVWRAMSPLVLAWLAFYFGRTLRHGETPLIERFARVGNPVMTQELRRYTRRLTGVWCAYFMVAMVALYAAQGAPLWSGACVWIGSAALFVGEHRLRPRLFPGEKFPGLLQQIRDTWSVWHKK